MNFLISFSGHSEVCVAQKRIFRFLEKPCTRVVTHASEIPFQFSLYLSKDNLLPKNLFKSINITVVFLFYSPYITLQNSFSVKYTHNRLKWCEIWFKTTMCEVQAHAYCLIWVENDGNSSTQNPWHWQSPEVTAGGDTSDAETFRGRN